MSIAQATLAEFEHEAATARRFIEAIPADKLTFRPHPKSHTLGELANHLATLPTAMANFLLADQGAIPDEATLFPQPASVAEVLANHDKSVETVKKILPTLTDADLQTNWTAIVGGKPAMTLPKSALLRMFMMNHWLHHRGQLGVHLRLAGAKVPSSYGPSGD